MATRFHAAFLLIPLAVASAAMAQRQKSPTRPGGAGQAVQRSMSPMGAVAKKRAAAANRAIAQGKATLSPRSAARAATPLGASTNVRVLGPPPGAEEPGKGCDNQPDCPNEDATGPAGGQAETSIAIDASGQHVVVGFNDTRGFSLHPISVSGFMYSDDGGKTFVDGGQLPTPGNISLGGTLFPAVFGDPDVKYLGGCNFVYSSILLTVKTFLPDTPTVVQTLSVHRSRDCGHTWEGPFEVTAATNPNGFIFSDGSAVDAADKEFIDYDQKTGRLILTWSNFTDPSLAPGGVQISSTYSDDLLSATPPTFSPAVFISATEADGQSSIPRFGPNGRDVFVSWRRFPGGNTNVIAFARSHDGGQSWGTPVETSAPFFTMDQVLGNDRVNTSPSMAVDRRGKNKGRIYLTYANNDSRDGADIEFQWSSDQGKNWSTPIPLNSRPGSDRAQWFPWVTVDDDTGRVYVFFDDQGVADSGDLMQMTYTFSDDGGRHWSQPAALSDRTFHAGWGNDTGQPNLGDYNQAVAQQGKLWAAYALASRPPLGFVDGQPSLSLTVPDVKVQVLPNPLHRFDAAPLDLVDMDVEDSGFNGFIDPGELFIVKLKLRNSDGNGISAETLEPLVGTLRTSTPGVDVLLDTSFWQRLSPGEQRNNVVPFFLFTQPGFVHGTPIELELQVRTEGHARTTLFTTLFTGTPDRTKLLSENFDGTPAGTLPAGWVAAHGAGSTVVPWTTVAGSSGSPGFCGTASNAAFHQEANDAADPTRWERLISPSISVPSDAEYVTLDFDVCYDTEDDPAFRIQAFDGFFLRVTDVTPGHTLRSVLAEAFEDVFRTDGFFHYPKHFPRSGDPNYFQDMSAWAGDSSGIRHVRMRLPGMAGTTFQLRFEYTQDSNGLCSDVRPGHSCGVLLDNVVVSSVKTEPRQPH